MRSVLFLAGLSTVLVGALCVRVYRLDANVAALERSRASLVESANTSTALAMEARQLGAGLMAEVDRAARRCEERTDYLRVVASILVAESNTKRVELPKPGPWSDWAAIVVPREPESWRAATAKETP